MATPTEALSEHIPGNITREEAAARAGLLSVHGYEVHVDLTTGPTTFTSTTNVTFDCAAPGADSWIDLIADNVIGATLNGEPIDPGSFDGHRLPLPALAGQNELTVTATCRYMRTGEGLHRFVDPVDDEVYLYTQFESADARRMYACFEQPDLKATFTLSVTAPQHWQVVSNAPAAGDPVPVGQGAAHWDFVATPPMSTYITALVAGPYHHVAEEYSGRFGTYPLGIYCRASLAEHLDSEAIFGLTKQGFAYFEDLFEMGYAFTKYDQLFVPEFNAGAMENAGCVTFLEDYVFRSRVTRAAYEQRANTILHEMAHMWFGDLVTMKWWDDLWLNESFAEWASHEACAQATEFTTAWTSFASQRKAWAYRQDQLPSTHPIAADMVDLEAVRINFDGITYAKGASALKQLVAWVGQDNFIAGIRAYFREHAWGNTELNDLLRHLEAASGRDLAPWAAQWLQTSGVNLLRPLTETDGGGAYTSVAISQEPPASPVGLPPTLRDHRIRIGAYSLKGASLERVASVELDITGPSTEVADLVGTRRPELLLLNDDDLTFAKVRLDAHSVGSLAASLGALRDPLARTLVWGSVWDMTRDAELTTGQFLDLVVAGLPSETDIGVVQTLLRQAHTAIEFYSTPANRDGYRERLADVLWQWLQEAEVGSDRQLALMRAFAGAASRPDHLDSVAAVLDGDLEMPGLTVDTDLRWSLLFRLVATGVRDDEAVESEARRDATAMGARNRSQALASRPIPSAKEEAWSRTVGSDDLPNAMVDATLAGFVQSDQTDLIRPFRERYFAAIDDLWRGRTTEIASVLTTMLFPSTIIEPATVAAADAFLTAGGHHPSAVRIIREGRDGVIRALKAQERDAAGPLN